MYKPEQLLHTSLNMWTFLSSMESKACWHFCLLDPEISSQDNCNSLALTQKGFFKEGKQDPSFNVSSYYQT